MEASNYCFQSLSLSLSARNNGEGKLCQVFNSCHASENILKYLSFRDCKELSLCSKQLCDVVRRSNKFSKSACIFINKESWDCGVLSKTTYNWLNAKIELSWLPPESYAASENILKTVTCLKVQFKVDPMEKILEKKLNFHLTRLLRCTSVLKCLWLDPSMMQWILHDTFSDVRVQDCLTKLRELHFVMVPDRCTANFLEEFPVDYEYYDDDDDEGPFPRNIFQISLIPMSLQAFSFVAQSDPCQKDFKFNRFVPNIMKKSARTLVDVTISLDGMTIQAIESILFPSLKSLNVKAWDLGGGKEVGKIIRNQPFVNCLSISAYTFSPNLLNSIIARSAKLKILHLQSKIWSHCIAPKDWKFLTNLTNLKDFKLCAETRKITLVPILHQLPSQLEKIAINGIYQDFGDEETMQTITELTKFRNLTELSLLGCENAINDDILDHIYYHMKQLTVLEFSLCPNVTDGGLTGFRGTLFMGVSIQNLQGLKTLTMRCCRQITSSALQKILKFPHLKSLDICGTKISEAAALEIVSSNPCLENFVTSFQYNEDQDQNPFFKYSIKDKIVAANPRTETVKIIPSMTGMEVFLGEM